MTKLDFNFITICKRAEKDTIQNLFPYLQEKIYRTYKKLLLQEKSNLKKWNITDSACFDVHSYSLYAAIAEHVTSDSLRQEFTRQVGNRMYNHIQKSILPSSGNLSTDISLLFRYLKSVGYVTKARICWISEDSFDYIMTNPIILSSAKRLYKEYSFGQHYSSRMLEVLLRQYGLHGHESHSFDPVSFKKKVIERWSIVKI